MMMQFRSFKPRKITWYLPLSSAKTFWKRRSSAASFSIYWRYSSKVVAPTMQLTTGQSRFKHIASIHGTIRTAGAHHGVQLIDKENGRFIFSQFINTALRRSSNSPRYLHCNQHPYLNVRVYYETFTPLTIRCANLQQLQCRHRVHQSALDYLRAAL